MRFYVVDDEPLALRGLVQEIKKVRPESDIFGFIDPEAVLKSLCGSGAAPDVVFLDVEMPGIDGISLAKSIKTTCPKANIIFVTSHAQYALDACSLHASGYLIKPVLPEDIRRELDDLRTPITAPSSRVRIQTFGNFDIFANNSPLVFARSKSKEALAYIVSKNGGSVTVAELAAVLWEARDYNRSLQNRTQTVISDMMKTLRTADCDNIIIKKRNSIFIDVTKVNCDYYRFLHGDAAAANAYMGEFMKATAGRR